MSYIKMKMHLTIRQFTRQSLVTMPMKRYYFIPLLLFMLTSTFAQETFPVNGAHDKRAITFALTHAHLVLNHQEQIPSGTLLIKEGIIVAVGSQEDIPDDAVVIDMHGKFIYPSFIDLASHYGVAELANKPRDRRPQFLSEKAGAFNWNQSIKPEYNAVDHFEVNAADAKALRGIGFGSVLSHQPDGIVRGTGFLATLGDNKEHLEIIKSKVSAHYSFDKGSSRQNYPGSLMGTIALLRQTYYDVEWYQAAKDKDEVNISLDAWSQLSELVHVFEVSNKLSLLRAVKLGNEFNMHYIIQGAGDEYQRLEEVKQTGAPLIVTLNFPKPFDVSDPLITDHISLTEMKHWEMAPANAGMLSEAGVEFVISPAKIKDKSDFLKNLRKTIKYGLSESAALKALTSKPAELLKIDDQLGSLKKGKIANFIVTSANIFDENSFIIENWVKGKRYTINPLRQGNLAGTYELKIEGVGQYQMVISGNKSKPKIQIKQPDDKNIAIKYNFNGDLITLRFTLPESDTTPAQMIRLSGVKTGETFWGKGKREDDSWLSWTATKDRAQGVDDSKDDDDDDDDDDDSDETIIGDVIYPFVAYGWTTPPVQETVLFKNATVWTNEAEGILQQYDVLIQDGKIKKLGKNIKAQNARVIDASGKHITCGIIDEHSHLAVTGSVNECTQAVTSEVKIGDVINSDDINIYRQLAGGVTSAQLLHGSCNPIGGQSAIIKFKWGFPPDALPVPHADKFIKFALGENVKQSNSRSNNRVRFPQTRMGVEQLYADAFTRAREYGQAWERYHALSDQKKSETTKPKRDLELDALLEILESSMFVTCHSYVQSEVAMLMTLAEDFGFRINTFTHILEGYKVADQLKRHGAFASTFSDWWAYKFEVIDAIPYNGALLNQAGVVTAYNSDDAEMGRRLNQEAAKAVKYGNVSQEDAWKFVTLNPAKMLHIDDRVGSIKNGKDADIVLWSENPLSIYSQVEQTYIDGICFYSMENDMLNRKSNKDERARLIRKMLDTKNKGEDTQPVKEKKEIIKHCLDT